MTSHDVAVVGAGLSGLSAARRLAGEGVDVVVLEGQQRVGGRTLSQSIGGGLTIDHGGQWVSPGQREIVALAGELGVELFDSWNGGCTVHWTAGRRHVSDGPFPAGQEGAGAALREAAARLTVMAASLPVDAPWEAADATEWDETSLRAWLDDHVPDALAAAALRRSIEGVFAGGPGETSLLAALAIIRSGAHEVTRLVAADDLGPERRFVGGAQQLCERMAAELGDRVRFRERVTEVQHEARGATVCTPTSRLGAQRVIITLPPALASRIRYDPALPAARDHLTQRTPMGWVIKVHCVYPVRFWADDGLSGKVASDEGAVRATADNSPPSGVPGVLVGFIEGAAARRLAAAPKSARRQAVLDDLRRYFGSWAGDADVYEEKSWGDDEWSRGAYGGYWTQGVWTSYGRALRDPVGPIIWSGTETSTAWNGKMEGAVHAGHAAAQAVLEDRQLAPSRGGWE